VGSAVLLAAGAVLSAAVVALARKLVPAPSPATELARFTAWSGKFASMGWAYLALVLALVGQLPLLFYAAALGSNMFALVHFVLGILAWRQG
jgi:hypothetical protein